MAVLNKIEFDDYNTEEYTRSWVTSVRESNRLLEYICNKIKHYSQNDWKNAEFKTD